MNLGMCVTSVFIVQHDRDLLLMNKGCLHHYDSESVEEDLDLV
jgi:hypothetical protein